MWRPRFNGVFVPVCRGWRQRWFIARAMLTTRPPRLPLPPNYRRPPAYISSTPEANKKPYLTMRQQEVWQLLRGTVTHVVKTTCPSLKKGSGRGDPIVTLKNNGETMQQSRRCPNASKIFPCNHGWMAFCPPGCHKTRQKKQVARMHHMKWKQYLCLAATWQAQVQCYISFSSVLTLYQVLKLQNHSCTVKTKEEIKCVSNRVSEWIHYPSLVTGCRYKWRTITQLRSNGEEVALIQ